LVDNTISYTSISQSDNEVYILNIDRSITYNLNRDFKIGEIIDFYEDLTAYENEDPIIGKAVVTGWNGGLNQLTIAVPTQFSAKLVLDSGEISNIIPLGKGDNFFPQLDYTVSVVGNSNLGLGGGNPTAAQLELSLGRITGLKFKELTIGSVTYDGYGRDYEQEDTVLIRGIDEFGNVATDPTDTDGTAKITVASNSDQIIESITVTDQGSQYFESPIVVSRGAAGTGLVGVVNIDNNYVISVDVVKGGSGFSGQPEIVFADRLSHTSENNNRFYLSSNSTKLASLVEDVTDTADEIFVETTGGFEGSGSFILGKEKIQYTAITDHSFQGCTRGINFNFDQKLTLADGGWEFNIGDILTIIRNASTEIAGGATLLRVYAWEEQNTVDDPNLLYIKYVIDSLAFIDAGAANEAGALTYSGGVYNTATEGSIQRNAQKLYLNDVDSISDGDTIRKGNIDVTVLEVVSSTESSLSYVLVELPNSASGFTLGSSIASNTVTINPTAEVPLTRVITDIEAPAVNLFDVTAISDANDDSNLDKVDQTLVVCRDGNDNCSSVFAQIVGWELLNVRQVDIPLTGFEVRNIRYPANTATGTNTPYGYISVKNFGGSSFGKSHYGVRNENTDFATEVSLDGGGPGSLYGLEEISDTGATIAASDQLTDNNGNVVTVEAVSPVNTGEEATATAVLTINAPENYSELQDGNIVRGRTSAFEGKITNVEYDAVTQELTIELDTLANNDIEYAYEIDNQQGEFLDIYTSGGSLITTGADKYILKTYRFTTLIRVE